MGVVQLMSAECLVLMSLNVSILACVTTGVIPLQDGL